MKTSLQWGILSTGRIAGIFARGVAHSQSGQLAAVGSRSFPAAKKFAQEFGVARAHGSYEALLADPGVEAVYIATPHPLHVEWIVRAAEAGKGNQSTWRSRGGGAPGTGSFSGGSVRTTVAIMILRSVM